MSTHHDDAGFRASLHTTTVADLIQLECAHRQRAIVCVRSDNRTGYLYFDGGNIVHAVAGFAIGEDAVFEILTWRGGTIVQCERPWPAAPTIQEPAPSLLLRAAQRVDEGGRRRPATGPVEPPERAASVIPIDRGQSERRAPAELAADGWHRDLDGSDRPPTDAVTIDAAGNTVATRGESDELAAVGAFVGELADRIGELLGLDPLDELSARVGQRDLVLRRFGSCTAVAVGERGLAASARGTS